MSIAMILKEVNIQWIGKSLFVRLKNSINSRFKIEIVEGQEHDPIEVANMTALRIIRLARIY